MASRPNRRRRPAPRARRRTQRRGRSRRSRGPSRLWLAAPLVAVGLVAAALAGAGTDSDESALQPTLFLGIDHQRSFAQAIEGGLPSAVADAVQICMDASCRLVADGLTGDTQASASLPVDETVDLPDAAVPAGADPEAVAADLAEQKATQILEALPRDPDGHCTDVFGGFLLAAQTLQSAPSEGRRHLIMVTDGVSNCGEWDILPSSRSASEREQFLRRLEETGLVADLEGVTVRVVGGGRAGSTTRGGEPQDSTRADRLEAFWSLYLDAAGATRPTDWWRPALAADGLELAA